MRYPVTPDGRYFVVKGRLWRLSDPRLAEDRRAELVALLMDARRKVAAAMRSGSKQDETAARAQVDLAKVALGERGSPWWDDGAPNYNRTLVMKTPYADWFGSWNLPKKLEAVAERRA